MAILVTSLGSKGPFLDKGEWTDVIEYQVTGAPNRYVAMVALGAYDQPHPEVPNIRCVKINPTDYTKITNGDGVVVQVYKFDAAYARSQKGSSQGNIRVHFGFVQEPADIDAAGNPILNSAGDPFHPPTSIEKLIIFFDVLKRQNSYSVATAKQYVGKVNKDAITLASLGACTPHTLRCLNYAPAEPFTVGDTDVLVLYQFAYREDNWDRKLLDQGFQAWYQGKGTPSPGGPGEPTAKEKGKLVYKKSPTQGISVPALLNGAGGPMTDIADGLSVDSKKGWNNWSTNPKVPGSAAFPLSGYTLVGTKGTVGSLPGGAYYLPYDMCGEISFSHFATVGV